MENSWHTMAHAPKEIKRPNAPRVNWCFTLNNYTPDEEKEVQALNCTYLVYGREVGEEKKTPHLQGYIRYDSGISFQDLSVAIPRARLSVTRSVKASIIYCKKDGDFFEKGVRPGHIKPLDQGDQWADLKNDISEPLSTIANNHFKLFARCSTGITKLRSMHLYEATRAFRDVTVTVIWGPPGSGKTRYCWEHYPDLYCLDFDMQGVWWDNYDGHDVLLIDDFNGQIKFTRLLRLLDGYQCRLPVKGGFSYAAWTRVLITTMYEPDTWYATKEEYRKSALFRRITQVVHIDELLPQPNQECEPRELKE